MKHKESENTEKNDAEKKPWLFGKTKIVALVLIVCALFLSLYYQLHSVSSKLETLETHQSEMIKELGNVRQSFLDLGADMNDTRSYLRLPTRNYFWKDEVGKQEETDANVNRVQLALFKYVESVGNEQKLRDKISEKKSFIEEFMNSPVFAGFMTKQKLTTDGIIENDEAFVLEIKDATVGTIITYKLEKETGNLLLITPNNETEITSGSPAKFREEAFDFIEKNKTSIIEEAKVFTKRKSDMFGVMNSDAVKGLLTKREITTDLEPSEDKNYITYTLTNRLSEPIGEISLDKKTGEIFTEDLSKKDSKTEIVGDTSKAVLLFLENLNKNTVIEKKSAQMKQDLEDTLKDKGFQLLLSNAGMKISNTPREDDSRIYYDLYTSGGTIVSSIVLEKATATINIVDPSGANSQNLLYFDPEIKKKTLAIPENIPIYGNEITSSRNTLGVLLVGKNGSLTDTIIFAQINEKDKKVRMVSVPRDLLYNGRKINAFAASYGISELAKVIQEISGYKVNKYVSIDMYAFIDVVDLIGGVDVHLDEPLIDPTYKVVDNGVTGTLHYDAGDYHLGGVESLRIARSRHSTSDFSRAKRQQIILKSIQTKAQNLGFGDVETLYEIARTILKKVETNITFDEAIAYYFRYQNYEIASNAVISTANILMAPPYVPADECAQMISDATVAGTEKPSCEGNNAYTLVPKDDDWNLIKWFFRQQFSGS